MYPTWEYSSKSLEQPEKITTRISDILTNLVWPEKMSPNDTITRASDLFFDFAFPWYSNDGVGLKEFKELFLRKYYMYQIGQETPALFKFNLQSRLTEYMPYWEEIYRTTTMQYNPLVNRKTTRTDNSKTAQNSSLKENAIINFDTQRTGSNSSNQDTQSINSDNPQVTVASKDYASTMDRGKYASTSNTSETGVDVTENNVNNTSTNNSNFDGITVEEGFVGSDMTDNIIKYRKAITNLNSDICEEMRGLFLMVYN